MKVALVHDMLVKMGGAEKVLNVFQELFPQAPIYTLLYDEKKCGSTFPKEKIKTSFLQKWGKFLPRQFLVTQMPQAIESFDFSGYDLVLISSNSFAHGVITSPNTKQITYAHAPMRYAWDYTHEYTEEKAGGNRLKKIILQSIIKKLRMWDACSSSRSDIILANSNTTKQRIQKYWKRDSQVLYPPVETDRFEVSTSKGDFFLIVSMLEPFKKVDLAVKVFSQLPKHKLVIIGDGSHKQYLESISGDNITFLGRKSDKEVQIAMQTCRAFLFPGLEDFGIAPVEAMACGKSVIAYGKGGVSESVIHHETGILFPEQTPESMLSGLSEFFEREEYFLQNTDSIRARSEQFSKKIFKENLSRIIQES